MKFVFKSAFLAALMVYAVDAIGATRTIDVTGTFEKEFFFPEAFGSTDAQLPLTIFVEFDDEAAGVVTLPAGTDIFSGETNIREITLIPASAINSLSATLGNGTWDASDLTTQQLATSGLSYAVLLDGALNGTSQLNVAMTLRDSDFILGEVITSTYFCGLPNCSSYFEGYAEDYQLGTSGPIRNVNVVLGVVEDTPEEQLDDLAQLVVSINVSSGISNALDSKLDSALNALDDTNENNDGAALNSMYAFCNSTEAQRGKKVSDTDADALIAAANGIIAAIDENAMLCE